MRKISYHLMRLFILTMVIFSSLALYRATVQPDYHWELLVIGGTGTSGDYPNIIALFLISWLTFLLILWYKKRWYYLFPITLTLVCFYFTLREYLLGKSDMTFNGDALNIHIDLGIIMVLITLMAHIATLCWSYMNNKDFIPLPKKKLSKLKLIMIIFGITLSALILYLFSLGNGKDHMNSDKIAVLLTIGQGILFYYIIETLRQERPKSLNKYLSEKD